jgi:hypothetical protein
MSWPHSRNQSHPNENMKSMALERDRIGDVFLDFLEGIIKGRSIPFASRQIQV